MNTIRLTTHAFLGGVILWWLLFIVCSFAQINPFYITDIFGLLFLLIVPGTLTLMLLRIPKQELWGAIGLAVGISVLELITVGLVGNTLLPLVGITHPLDGIIIIAELSILFAGSVTLLWIRTPRPDICIALSLPSGHTRDIVYAFFPMLFVVLSILGTIRLNNGGSGELTLVMLIGIGIYMATLMYATATKKLHRNVIPTALFFVSLALLFMTSLRGWHITGHDIAREYHVFMLTKTNSIWNIAQFKDAYNACLSITLLPTVLANILDVSAPYIYKAVFQSIFAIVPSIVYITFRRYVSAWVALLSAFYFIAFPTFFSDMPMLNRQEIAFLFLALMMYLMNTDTIPLSLRRILFVIFGFGMIFSHYSTTYVVIALLLFLIIIRPIAYMCATWMEKKPLFKKSGIALSTRRTSIAATSFISLWMVVVLAFGSFLWSSVLTDTSSNSIVRVITKTLDVMRDNSKEGGRSSDVLYAFFSWKILDAAAILEDYEHTFVTSTRANATPGTYYGDAELATAETPLAEDLSMPLTPLGKSLSSLGVNVPTFSRMFRQLTAKMLQILVIIGCVYVLFRNKFTEQAFPIEFVLLALGSIFMLLSQILLPVLSAEYGVLRMFQQSLMLLGVFIAIGSLALCAQCTERTRTVIASSLVIIFFFSTTGVLTQLSGGYPPQLHLNNAGSYYDLYYLHDTELAGIDWLSAHVSGDARPLIQTDLSEQVSTAVSPEISVSSGIYPGLVLRGAYVFLNTANTRESRSVIIWNSDAIPYNYPVQFLDKTKDLIYTNGEATLYR